MMTKALAALLSNPIYELVPIRGMEEAAAALPSHASVTVMLACEDEWDLEFPQQMLKKSTFASVANIRDALGELGVDDASVARA